jgi:N-acetylgalactosamine-N,N'-diacetylbacillosaminyl-diphospho-undecaprenol 4-alpha-N-acetylgalactosaminyltransferase
MRPSFIFEFILSRLIYPKNTFYTVLSGFLNFYFPKNNFLSKLIYANRKIITVSKAIEKKILELQITDDVVNLYQPFDFESIWVLKEEFHVDSNYILAVGNMDNNIKQIDQLIEVYSKSKLPLQNVKLIILGEGKLKKQYVKLVENLNITHLVEFKGLLKNPFPYYKNALFLVLSSKNEGLSNAIIESLACQTPVVAFDCFSGPGEIIENNKNGLLVENQNFDKLVQAMNRMLDDKELYNECKKIPSPAFQDFR